MFPSDRRSPRKVAVLWGIAAFVCAAVFVCPRMGICQPAGGAAEKGKPVASGIDALEVLRIVFIPFRNNPNNPKAIAASPDTFAVFRYKWSRPGGMPVPDFSKSVGGTFTLTPEDGKKYKVIEIKGREVVIELPDGTKKTLAVPQ